MPVHSAGVLLYRRKSNLEVLIAHPGGPYFAKKDERAWTIPKGEVNAGEEPRDAAAREFSEETGQALTAEPLELGVIKQPSGKILHIWAAEQDLDPAALASNTFSVEWPPRSGRIGEYPEVDRLAWVAPDVAREKLVAGQVPFLDLLEEKLRT